MTQDRRLNEQDIMHQPVDVPKNKKGKHTPAPWRYLEPVTETDWPAVQRKDSGGFVVTAENYQNAIADAHLIAAAPELLEACEMQLKLIEDMAKFVSTMVLQDYSLFNDAPMKSRTAIKKAKGES